MSEFWPNMSTDYFDGNTILDSLLSLEKLAEKFIPPVDNVKHKPVDDTDVKLIGYLTGRKVYFSEEELKKYIIE